MDLRMFTITFKMEHVEKFSAIYKVTASIREYLERNTKMWDPEK